MSGISGDVSNIRGDVIHIRGVVSPAFSGDVSRLRGDIGGLSGCATPLYGDATGAFGDIDACRLDDEAPGSVDISWLYGQTELDDPLQFAEERDDAPSP